MSTRQRWTLILLVALALGAALLLGRQNFERSHSGTTTTTAATAAVGSGLFAPSAATKTSGCQVLPDERPDPACTPGAVFTTLPDPKLGNPAAIAAVLCDPQFHTGDVRGVSQSEKVAVFREYGIDPADSSQYEIDHLISLELGGSNDIANLWPEKGKRPNPKDAVENRLHADVCANRISLADAQRLIATDWHQYQPH